jgi:hypothetical protein
MFVKVKIPSFEKFSSYVGHIHMLGYNSYYHLFLAFLNA